VREAFHGGLGLGNAHAGEHRDGPLTRLRPGDLEVVANVIGELTADAGHGVQAGRRILEDHADAPAPNQVHLLGHQLDQVGEGQVDAAADSGARRQQAENSQTRHGFAGAK
jgi:hypothetical protein